MSFPRISTGFAKRAGRIPRDQIGGRQKGTARLFYKRPLRSQKLVVYPPAIHLAHIGFLSSFLFFFFFNPSPANRNAHPKVVDQREVDRTGPRFMPSNSFPARARFHLRLSRFDYLLGEAYRLLIYSAVTNYDDLAGQWRYLFPLVRTSGFWWKRDRLELVSPGRELFSPRRKKQRVIGGIHHLRIIGLNIYGTACPKNHSFFFLTMH